MEVNKIISHALQSMPPSKRQKAFAKDTSKLIHMGLNENNYGMSPKAVAALEDSMAGSHFYPDFAAVLLKQKRGRTVRIKSRKCTDRSRIECDDRYDRTDLSGRGR